MATRTKPSTDPISSAPTIAQMPATHDGFQPTAGGPETRPETRPGARPETRPETRPGARPETRSWSLQEQLDLAIRIEKVAAQIYAVLARRFGDSPSASAMFNRLEYEEQQHALRIEMLGTVLARRPELQRAPVLDVMKLQQALRDGEDVALLVADPSRKLPLSQARRLAAALERKFSDVHAEQLTTISEPSLHELFSIFVAQDAEHAALLAGTET